MPDESNSSSEEKSTPVDISSLKDLNLGPAWESHSGSQKRNEKRPSSAPQSGSGGSKPAGGGADRRRFKGKDFHKATPEQENKNSFSREKKFDRTKKFSKEAKPRPFRPVLDVQFYPEDNPFQALIKAMSQSLKTYELFNIAKLLIENPKLFVAVIQPFSKEGEASKLMYRSLPEHVPFFSEDDAIAYSLTHHLDHFFEVEEKEGEAPSGTFSFVHKCKKTGELIGPTNFHLYNQLLQEHHANHFPDKPLDYVQSLLETVKEEEAIAQWIEKMKIKRTYKLKLSKESVPTPEPFESLEYAKRFLLANFKDEVVRSGKSVRISARTFEALPEGDIKKSILAELEYQKKFPLRVANNLRGRLRRENFHLYKKGAEGVSYLCWVKRKFRTESDEFAPEIEKLLLFIESSEKLFVKELPEKYLGFDQETIARLEKLSRPAKPEDTEPAPEKSPEDQALLKTFAEMMRNLRWLLSEGYITEYENGELFARSPLPPQKTESAEPSSTEETPAPESKASSTTEAAATTSLPADAPEETNEEEK